MDFQTGNAPENKSGKQRHNRLSIPPGKPVRTFGLWLVDAARSSAFWVVPDRSKANVNPIDHAEETIPKAHWGPAMMLALDITRQSCSVNSIIAWFRLET